MDSCYFELCMEMNLVPRPTLEWDTSLHDPMQFQSFSADLIYIYGGVRLKWRALVTRPCGPSSIRLSTMLSVLPHSSVRWGQHSRLYLAVHIAWNHIPLMSSLPKPVLLNLNWGIMSLPHSEERGRCSSRWWHYTECSCFMSVHTGAVNDVCLHCCSISLQAGGWYLGMDNVEHQVDSGSSGYVHPLLSYSLIPTSSPPHSQAVPTLFPQGWQSRSSCSGHGGTNSLFKRLYIGFVSDPHACRW